MLSRNRELRMLALTYLMLTAALVVGGSLIGGARTACWTALAALALAVPVAIATWNRYRAIARLAAALDIRLHSGRAVDFDTMREGELALLGSELEKLISSLDLATEHLERERGRLADSLADISHQLKTPLTSLSIMTELVRKRIVEHGGALSAQDAAELSERLRTVEQLQGRVQWLVASLLKLARIDAGVVRLARQRVDAAELVREAAAPLAIPFDLADVALAQDIQPGAGFEGDPSWSAEALANVLKNCLEHAPAGGHVRVRVREDALACRIRVEDDGPGIAACDLPHVFERFYRGSDARDQEASEVNPAGVGIGLSLSRSLIAAQGGTITAGNVLAPDGSIAGARFDIVFFKTAV